LVDQEPLIYTAAADSWAAEDAKVWMIEWKINEQ
jgi:hypothetical protein